MAKRRIFTVGLVLPGDQFEYVALESDQTLLDADIVLFEPGLGYYSSYETYNGKPLLDASSSFATKERLEHWRSEILTAVDAGKLVIVYLTKPVECFLYTGQKEYSGTGRRRATTNIVADISSYEGVPNLRRVVPKSGTGMRLQKQASYLAPYWAEFSACSPYEVELEGDFNRILLKSQAGDRIVGAAVHRRGGALLFLPPLQYDEEEFLSDDDSDDEADWTEEALRFGSRLTSALVSLDDCLKQGVESTPPPDWTRASEYRLAEEGGLECAISQCNAEIAELQTRRTSLKARLEDAGNLRRLLFEQGRPLESAILDALKSFGFEAKPFSDGESEFDAVFLSAEGRCLGETEGKDNKPINISKFSQLERNLQEDFARDDTDEYAKGVLFGNAYRLARLTDRGEFFTQKCISAAKRTGAALVRTPDLFAPAKYLKENSADTRYAKQCREAIFRAKGETVVFPQPPTGEDTSPVQGEHTSESAEADR